MYKVEASRSAAVSYHSIDSYLEYNSGSIEGLLLSDDKNNIAPNSSIGSNSSSSSSSSSSTSSYYDKLINTCNHNNINANYVGDLEKKVFDVYMSLKS